MPSPPTLLDRSGAIVLQVGAIAVVLVAAPYKAFDLDRFFVPKELALVVAAGVVALLCLIQARRLLLARVDELLALFLALGLASALFAVNWWLAGRAVAVSLAGAAAFWTARTLAARGLERRIVAALVVAGIVGAVTALLQAYGVRSDFVSLNRAPGGTFGNRNFMAHLCVVALPALALTALRAGTRRRFLGWAAGGGFIAAALVLSRSRAAWLALLVAAALMVPLAIVALRRGRDGVRLRRLLLLPVVAALGGGLALVLPNTLDWRSDSPYLDTARSVVDYKEGSGHGRLVQYGTTLRMSLRHPLLGVGPGNWAVEYPRFAAEGDPSLSSEGMTANPWPSSDWMTFLSERGVIAFGALVLAMLALAADGLRGVTSGDSADARLRAATLLGTLGALLVVGSFDAVLLLPVPAFVAWAMLGALSQAGRTRREVALAPVRRALAVAATAAAFGLAATRSAAQLSAMALFSNASRSTQLERAAQRDPGSYRIQVRLATGYVNRGSCTRARAHALRARALFPNAPAPQRILRECGG